MEYDLNSKLNGRQPQFQAKWKTTSILMYTEGDLNLLAYLVLASTELCTAQPQLVTWILLPESFRYFLQRDNPNFQLESFYFQVQEMTTALCLTGAILQIHTTHVVFVCFMFTFLCMHDAHYHNFRMISFPVSIYHWCFCFLHLKWTVIIWFLKLIQIIFSMSLVSTVLAFGLAITITRYLNSPYVQLWFISILTL